MARRKSVGCIAMVIVTAVGAIFSGVGFFLMLKPEWEAKKTFVEGQCTIIGKELIESRSASQKDRNRIGGGKLLYRPEFHIRHEVGGQAYEARTYRIVQSSSGSKSGNQAILDRFEVGKSYPCWYDPTEPGRVVLDRDLSMMAIVFTGIGVAMVLFGALGTVVAVLRGTVGRLV